MSHVANQCLVLRLYVHVQKLFEAQVLLSSVAHIVCMDPGFVQAKAMPMDKLKPSPKPPPKLVPRRFPLAGPEPLPKQMPGGEAKVKEEPLPKQMPRTKATKVEEEPQPQPKRR